MHDLSGGTWSEIKFVSALVPQEHCKAVVPISFLLPSLQLFTIFVLWILVRIMGVTQPQNYLS